MLEKIKNDVMDASRKLEKLNENYHFLCTEARSNIDYLCSMHMEIEQMMQKGITAMKESVNEIFTFLHLVDTEHELVFEPIKE